MEIKTAGIPETGFGNGISLFPNPTGGDFSIDLGSVHASAGVSIADIAGKVIRAVTITESQVIHLSIDEPAGLYFVTVRSGEREVVFKLVKE